MTLVLEIAGGILLAFSVRAIFRAAVAGDLDWVPEFFCDAMRHVVSYCGFIVLLLILAYIPYLFVSRLVDFVQTGNFY